VIGRFASTDVSKSKLGLVTRRYQRRRHWRGLRSDRSLPNYKTLKPHSRRFVTRRDKCNQCHAFVFYDHLETGQETLCCLFIDC
jgi:hypothetical protein